MFNQRASFAFLLNDLTTVFLPAGTRWNWARLSSGANLEPLSSPLPADIRLLHPPIPAPHCVCFATDLPPQQRRDTGLLQPVPTTSGFRLNNRMG
jgi:hypothetical protein